MPMKVGIVGMPNAGKSSLFTALTGVAAEAANYPFTTIEPNVAIVPVADPRLDAVAETVRASKVVPDTIAFHDIAGLVAGAHRGEGLGNQFLANIRETDAIVHVVRAHEDESVVHPEGRVDPLADIETIETELVYADLEQAERRRDRVVRTARGGDRHAIAEAEWLERLIEALQAGRPARTVPPPADAVDAMTLLSPLTAKPVLFVANVEEGSDRVPPEIAAHAAAVGAQAVAVSARLESELGELSDDDAAAMREDLGLAESGLETVVHGAFSLLQLVAFFTAGEDKPAQSWHLRQGLSVWHAAGLIHSDIQRGFVRAEVVVLGRPARRRRVRRRPRPRHAAPRGTRLRGRRRRRDHGEVHSLTAHPDDESEAGRQFRHHRCSEVGQRLRVLEALGQPVHPQRPGRLRPAAQVGLGVGRGRHVGCAQGGDLLERPQLVGVVAQGGGDARALGVGGGDCRLQRAVSLQQCGGGLGPDARCTREAVGWVTAQGDEIGNQLRARSRSAAGPRAGRPPRSRWPPA